MSPTCPIDRYTISDLSELIYQQEPSLKVEDIAQFLATEVNNGYDKVPPEQKDEFTAKGSISAFEVYNFWLQDRGASPIGKALLKLFSDGNHYSDVPPPHPVAIKSVHDADTVRATEEEDSTCNIKIATYNLRTSGIDAPEIGNYKQFFLQILKHGIEIDERLLKILGILRSGGARASFLRANPLLRNTVDEVGQILEDLEKKGAWVNSKLVENIIQVYAHLVDNVQLPEYAQLAVTEAIGESIVYTGKIATFILQDFKKWVEDNGAHFLGVESMIRWTSSDTPKALCGTWQPYDRYGRRLSSFLVTNPTLMLRYIREELPRLVDDSPELKGLYNEYAKKMNRLTTWLRNFDNERAQGLGIFFSTIFSPDELLYNPDAMAKAAEEVVKAAGATYSSDVQIMQIITGSVYNYMKYRNQDSEAYKLAGQSAYDSKFGFWKEPTFRILFEIHSKDPRYSPPDCM